MALGDGGQQEPGVIGVVGVVGVVGIVGVFAAAPVVGLFRAFPEPRPLPLLPTTVLP